MATGVTVQDLTEIRILKELGVLESVNPCHLHGLSAGDILATCGDGDRVLDMIDRHCLYQRAHREAARPHLLTKNGGPLRIVLDVDRGGLDLMEDIAETLLKVKVDMSCISLVGHTPCGKYPLHPHETISHLVNAQALLANFLAGHDLHEVTIRCFYHVDLGDFSPPENRFRTKLIHPEKAILMPNFVYHGAKVLIER